MNETLFIDFAGSTVSEAAFSTALRTLLAASPGESANIQVSPGYGRANESAGVATERYTAALDDAASKARALAQHAGLKLGPIVSIAEGYNGTFPSGNRTRAPAGVANVMLGSVQASQNQPIVLSVVYDLAGGEGRSIAVVGLSSSANGISRARRGATDQLSVVINARGKTLSEATAVVERYEALVHKAAAQTGLRDSAIVKGDSSFNVY